MLAALAVAVALAGGAAALAGTAPVPATNACATPDAFWGALESGLNPMPGTIRAPVTGWQQKDVDMTFTLVEDGVEDTWTGDEVGFRFFELADVPANSMAIVWGTPDRPVALIGEEGAFTMVHSNVDIDGGVCLTAHAVVDDPTQAGPHLDDAVAVAPDVTNPGASSGSACGSSGILYMCLVGTASYCDATGHQTAWDKMSAMAFAAWADFSEQTNANSWSSAWLKCYIGSDPFDYSKTGSNSITDFRNNEVLYPAGSGVIMHLFTTHVSGGWGECPGQWGTGDYSTGSTPTLTDKNILLHEMGHNFDAAHETASGASCAGGSGEADQFPSGKYSIMYNAASDSQKVRDFTDGSANNLWYRNNVVYINAETNNKI